MQRIHCAGCGEMKERRKMIRRRLNGRDHFCCSLPCEVQWEKENLVGICG